MTCVNSLSGVYKFIIPAIHHFFEINDVALNSRKIKKFLPSDDSYREDRPYSIEEISRMLDKYDIRQRVIILLLTSTGMRVGALPVLRIGDIKKFEEHNLYLIWVYNNSRKDRYYTFCSVECANAIDDYLAYRKRLGEEIKDSNPLIRNKVTADNPFVVKAPKSINVRSIQLIIKKLQKEAGIVLKDKNEIASCHGFRKAYISTRVVVISSS